MRPPLRSEAGQASVELVGTLPFILLSGLVAWQFAICGHTLWLTANAARAAARADVVGASPRRAARSALPRSLERGLRVRRLRAGGARVQVRMPLILRRWRSPLRLGATARLGERP